VDLRQILRAIRANVIVAVVVFVFCVAIGGADAVLPAKQYQATTLLLAQPSASVTDPAADVGAIQVVIPQLVIEAETPTVFQSARSAVFPLYQNVSVSISATGDPASNSLTLSATSTDPKAAAAYANAAAVALINLAKQQSKELLTLNQLGTALVPSAPDNPKTPILFAAVAFGAIAAIFAALGANSLRRRFRKVDEVRERVGLPVLAEVPRFARSGARPIDIFLGGEESAHLEAFHELRSSLLLMFPGSHPVFAVTSCDEGEGKSSVAANLAWALASESRPVVAVDCDLRKPTLHTQFGVSLSPGVSNFAAMGLTSLIWTTQNTNLGVIPAGIPDRHPAEIVSSDVPLLFNALRAERKGVVLDCPPLSGAVESMTLAVKADAVILVVDGQRFDPERLQRNVARLDEAGAKVAGVVLNRVRRAQRYSYGSYGGPQHHPRGAIPTVQNLPPVRNP
jgi:capsular exopolysaccharide synthesis family protein